MTDISKLIFKRKFSFCPYKSLKLTLGKMSFSKDFITDTRGNLYPVLSQTDDICERIYNGRYIAEGKDKAKITRLMGGFFPYASYEVTIDSLSGQCGFEFSSAECGKSSVLFNSHSHCAVFYIDGKLSELSARIAFEKGMKFEVSCRVNSFDVYVLYPSATRYAYVCTFKNNNFSAENREDVFKNTTAALCFFAHGNNSYACISQAQFYLDSGVSVADMRPIRYENGDIMVENGKVYITSSIRLQDESYQGVLSWIPGTCEFELTGALFFDVGDGIWGNDVASTVVYNRLSGKWNIWYCSFSHNHILASAECEGEVRFGVNVIDAKLMPQLADGADDKVFLGKIGDEDPNFIYDEASKKWYMTVCRLASDNSGYKYYLFETKSENPFEGWQYVTNSSSGEETGGSVIKLGDSFVFACGNSFKKRANYRVYKLPDLSSFSELEFDYDDGGFRGWGTIMPLKLGTRTVYYHLTFDRHNGSSLGYNWSYGNIYCFEGYDCSKTKTR